jgi:CO/xanthine dehydrogenase FAD-binding subunit
MDFLAPTTWADALAAKAEHPDAVPVTGGTDVMVEINFDHRRPAALLDLTRVPDLQEWGTADDGRVRLGAGVTYTRIIDELGDRLPGLAMAARTVG